MVDMYRRDSSVPLANFNDTNIWSAPHAALNSTEAFDSASSLEEAAYLANRYFFIGIMAILLAFIAWEARYIVARMRWAGWRAGWSLGSARRATRDTQPTTRDTQPTDAAQTTFPSYPHRVSHPRLPFPVYTIPGVLLTIPQFILVTLSVVAVLGVAAWCQSAFLTHTSRSTLIIMCLVCLAAALSIKVGGIGTWTAKGYAAVNFLHRWIGRMIVLLAILHVVAYIVAFYRAGSEFAQS